MAVAVEFAGLFRLIILAVGEADPFADLEPDVTVAGVAVEFAGLFRLIIPEVGEADPFAALEPDVTVAVEVEFAGLFKLIMPDVAEADAFADLEAFVPLTVEQLPDREAAAPMAVGAEPLDDVVIVALFLPLFLCLAEVDIDAEAPDDFVLVDVVFGDPLPLPTPGSDVISVN